MEVPQVKVLRQQLALVALLCSVDAGLHDIYEVRLTLQEAVPTAPAPTHDDEAKPRVIGMSMRNQEFDCKLPSGSTRGSQERRAERANRYVASARAAALASCCLFGQVEGSSDLFELCINDRFSVAGSSAAHEASSDRVFGVGGFEQRYEGIAGSGQSLRAHVRCECQLGPAAPAEPRCRPGDLVKAPRDGQLMAAIVAAVHDGGERLQVVWAQAGFGSSGSSSSSHSEIASIEVIAANGDSCGGGSNSVPVAVPLAEVSVASSELGQANRGSDTAPRSFTVRVATATCCSARQLGTAPLRDGETAAGDLGFRRLLSPLVGRCLLAAYGWWTYELCWPWRLRQLHHATSGEVEVAAITLGRFDGVGLSMRRATPRTHEDLGRYELVAALNGDACEQTVHKWTIIVDDKGLPDQEDRIKAQQSDMYAIGGFFNPASCGAVQGILFHDESNPEGCSEYSVRLEGKVVLVKRGKCWFHTKALKAEAAGATAVIVFNDRAQMIDVMEGVYELPPPRIPTVLVDRGPAGKLQNAVGSRVKLAKVIDDSERPISTSVIFRCGNAWGHRRNVCEPGDEVDVKVINSNSSVSTWPYSAVRILRASVVDVDRSSRTAKVSWHPVPDDDGSSTRDLPSSVPMNMTYHGGVPCSSDGDAYFEDVVEPQACQSEFVVHVAALCANARLMPPQPPEAQVIACHARDADRVTRARQEWEAERELRTSEALRKPEVDEQAEGLTEPAVQEEVADAVAADDAANGESVSDLATD